MTRGPGLETPYWTVPMLAQEWGVHEHRITIWLQTGQLEALSYDVDGVPFACITDEERRRAEGTRLPINRRRENNLLRALGLLAIAFAGGDRRMIEEPGSIWSEALGVAACHGAGVGSGPSEQTAAAALRDGIALLKAEGCFRPNWKTDCAATEGLSQPLTRHEARSAD